MAEPGNGATLHSYLVVLRRRKWWVIAIAAARAGGQPGPVADRAEAVLGHRAAPCAGLQPGHLPGDSRSR